MNGNATYQYYGRQFTFSHPRLQHYTFLNQHRSVHATTSFLLLLSPVAMKYDGSLSLSLGVVAFNKFLSCFYDHRCC